MSKVVAFTIIYYPTASMAKLGYNKENPYAVVLLERDCKRELKRFEGKMEELKIGMWQD